MEQSEIARLAAELEEVKADRDKWFESAGAHHVASMKQAQRADRAEFERDTARAETAALIERAAVLCDGTAKYHMSDPDDIDVVGLTAREIRTLTPAHAKAALAARDKATREAALRECVAYHQGEIDRLDAQIADNEAYMKRSGRGVSEANKFCRDQQSSHRISRDAILALI